MCFLANYYARFMLLFVNKVNSKRSKLLDIVREGGRSWSLSIARWWVNKRVIDDAAGCEWIIFHIKLTLATDRKTDTKTCVCLVKFLQCFHVFSPDLVGDLTTSIVRCIFGNACSKKKLFICFKCTANFEQLIALMKSFNFNELLLFIYIFTAHT